MKQTLYLFCIITSLSLKVECQPTLCHDKLFDTSGAPSQALIALLAETKIKHNGTPLNILQQVQYYSPRGFIRPPGLEHGNQLELFEDKTKTLVPLYDKLGFCAEMSPTKSAYNTVILLSGSAKNFRHRIQYFCDLIKTKKVVDVGSIIVQTGAEPVPLIEDSSPEYFQDMTLSPVVKTWIHPSLASEEPEDKLMKILLAMTQWPEELRNTSINTVASPLCYKPDGQRIRATTKEPLLAWLAKKPTPGDTLVISNQPHICKQDATFQITMPKSFTTETVGPRLFPDTKNAVILDEIARVLYNELDCPKGLEH
jgi:hypothetical protein